MTANEVLETMINFLEKGRTKVTPLLQLEDLKWFVARGDEGSLEDVEI